MTMSTLCCPNKYLCRYTNRFIPSRINEQSEFTKNSQLLHETECDTISIQKMQQYAITTMSALI